MYLGHLTVHARCFKKKIIFTSCNTAINGLTYNCVRQMNRHIFVVYEPSLTVVWPIKFLAKLSLIYKKSWKLGEMIFEILRTWVSSKLGNMAFCLVERPIILKILCGTTKPVLNGRVIWKDWSLIYTLSTLTLHLWNHFHGPQKCFFLWGGWRKKSLKALNSRAGEFSKVWRVGTFKVNKSKLGKNLWRTLAHKMKQGKHSN